MSNLCIIPARGGSKRLPRKNIRPFCGKPIILYAIDAAIASGCFDQVVVSTEDQEIAQVAKERDVRVIFRSHAAASDTATLSDVLIEVCFGYFVKNFEAVCCVLPTAALLDPEDLKKTRLLLGAEGVEQVLPVVRFSYPIQRALTMDAEKTLKLLQPEHLNSMSNHLAPTYHDAGLFYWMRHIDFLRQQKIILEKTIGYEIPESRVQDIDTEEDWQLAEMKFKHLRQGLGA